jgi:predicted nucleotidyltransferase
MDEPTKQMLAEKNKKIIEMVIERARRDFPDEIALVGLTGSFATGDFHRKSDLDLIIVNNTDAGWGIAECFVFDDVGYDIYCTPWERLERKAELDDAGVSSLTDLQILYSQSPEALERFNRLKERALHLLASPIGLESVNRAKKHMDLAKQEYADVMMSNEIGAARYASCGVLYHLVNALVSLNNTCIKRGIKRYLEELLSYTCLPDDFKKRYMDVIEAKTIGEIKETTLSLLQGVAGLYETNRRDFTTPPVPSYDNLKGTYEELWSNCRNKVLASAAAKDKSYAYFAAMGAQNYLDEMTVDRGTRKFDLMRHFDADDLDSFKDAFMEAMEEYRDEYSKVGREVLMFDSFEALYEYYYSGSQQQQN